MLYILTITLGLIICVLLFAQLRNEARKQNEQVRTFFCNLAIVAYPSADDPTKSRRLFEKKQRVVHPIESTSTTCGKDNPNEKHHLDFPITTNDSALKESAVEFCVEPDAENLRLYVRLLDQPFIWVCFPNYSKNILVCNENAEKELCIPAALKEKLKENRESGTEIYLLRKENSATASVFPSTLKKQIEELNSAKMPNAKIKVFELRGDAQEKEKALLHIGDVIYIGNTMFEIDYNREEKK